MKLHKKLLKMGASVFNTLAQTEAHHNPEKTITPGMPELLRSAAAQSAVLLENRVLAPWTHNKTIQKAIESYRISPNQKEYLKTMKYRKR